MAQRFSRHNIRAAEPHGVEPDGENERVAASMGPGDAGSGDAAPGDAADDAGGDADYVLVDPDADESVEADYVLVDPDAPPTPHAPEIDALEADSLAAGAEAAEPVDERFGFWVPALMFLVIVVMFLVLFFNWEPSSGPPGALGHPLDRQYLGR
jgi:hypothetical protein